MVRWQPPSRWSSATCWRVVIVGSAFLWLVFGLLVILAGCEALKAMGYVT